MEALAQLRRASPSGVVTSAVLAAAVWLLLRVLMRRLGRRGKPLPSPPGHWLLGHTPIVGEVVSQGRHIDYLI